jgi:hypothetical protein
VGVRIGQFAAALCLLACAGCGIGTGEYAAPRTAGRPSPTVATSAAPASEPPYAEPDDELRAVATRFVSIALDYDASTEARRDFLSRLKGLATGSELRRLQGSGRAQLRWWVLRQRAEQATVHVTGVSQSTAIDDRVHLEVEAVRVTHSTVAEVRDFVAVTLVVVPPPAGWRVDHAAGGGL